MTGYLERQVQKAAFDNHSGKKKFIVQKLREQGCRITKQRLMLLDIILEDECSCCKEIYYKASKLDKNIGTATVYRMVNTLEEIGAIDRKNMYKIACCRECEAEDMCMIELDDHTSCCLSSKQWLDVIKAGLKTQGYIKEQNIVSAAIKQCGNK